MKKDVIYEALKLIDLQMAEKLGLPPINQEAAPIVFECRYFVEACFLKRYFDKIPILRVSNVDPCEMSHDFNSPDQGIMIRVSAENDVDGPLGVSLQIIYSLEKDQWGNISYDLTVGDGSNIIYTREAGQDPLTEWRINELANDLCDHNGEIIFAGEPVQI